MRLLYLRSMCARSVVAFAIALSLSMSVVDAYAQVRSSEDEEQTYSRFQINRELQDKIDALPQKTGDAFRIPILMGVEPSQIYDSWGDARSGGRSHEGNDILAPRGAFIVSPTDAIVGRIGVGSNGGNYVYTFAPGGERFYYAHLDAYAEGLETGQVLKMGDLIGYVGNSGNASGGPPHLHLGIYNRGAQNPYPRLTLAFSDDERLASLTLILEKAADTSVMARKIIALYKPFITSMKAKGSVLPAALALELTEASLVEGAKRDLTLEAKGADVILLQEFLIAKNSGPAALALKEAGASGYFGPVTQKALLEFQQAASIAPATGYFGPLTRSALAKSRSAGLVSVHKDVLVASGDLDIGARGKVVESLQSFLITANVGPAAKVLADAGASGYFGPVTQKALAEYQKSVGLVPATGYFGPKTRAHFASAI